MSRFEMILVIAIGCIFLSVMPGSVEAIDRVAHQLSTSLAFVQNAPASITSQNAPDDQGLDLVDRIGGLLDELGIKRQR